MTSTDFPLSLSSKFTSIAIAKMSPPTRRKQAPLLLALGSMLLIVSLALPVLYSKLYEMVLYQKMPLVKGSLLYKYWQDVPFPIYQRLYFFNITNPGDFLNSGAKLKVTEVGPYTYRGKWVKDILGWHKNGTVSYKEVRTYHFLPEKSTGTDDVIINFNGPVISVAKEFQHYNLIARKAFSSYLRRRNEHVINVKTIRELTYGGYKDTLMKFALYTRHLKPGSHYKDGNFAWLYGINGSDEGVFTVSTGEGDLSELNVIDTWNGKRNLDIWDGETCNMINGTTGDFGPPLRIDQKFQTFFIPTFCRSFTYEFSSQESVRGLLSRKFTATKSTLDNPSKSCFRTVKDLPSGVHHFGPCLPDAPGVISYPHFYLSDPSFMQSIEGLNPQPEVHESYTILEPNTGLGVKLAIRLQINMILERVEGCRQLENIPEGIYPVYWTELSSILPEELCQILKFYISDMKIVYHCVVGLLIVVSVGIICAGVGILKRRSAFKEAKAIPADVGVPLLNGCAQRHHVDRGGYAGMSNGVDAVSKLNESLEDSSSTK